ncbi:MAG: zinc ribbon domain-containing protein [Lachnospiraceae bacterium]|nr:zinc ribbon domain-containing protein [Lachnospiraceae bacterium]
MKYCRNCGAPVAPENKFCKKCGAPVNRSVTGGQGTDNKGQDQIQGVPYQAGLNSGQSSTQTRQYGTQASGQGSQNAGQAFAQAGQNGSQPIAAAKPVNKKLLIALVAAVCAAVVLILGIHFYRHTYIISDFVKVKCEGYDEYGSARAYIDQDKLSRKLSKLYGLSDKDLEDYSDLASLGGDFKKAMLIESFVDSIEPEVKTKAQGKLANSDEVVVKVKYSKAYAKKLGLHIFGLKKAVTVNGLSAVDVIDPFEDVSISYAGALPYLTPVIDTDDSDFNNYDFSVSSDQGVTDSDGRLYLTKKGQEFTVTFEGDTSPSHGHVYSPAKKTFKVGKTDTLVTDPTELTATDRKQLAGHASKYLRDQSDDIKSLKFIGCVTAVANSADDINDYPEECIVLFKAKYDDWFADDLTGYTYVEFPNVAKQSDGSLWYNSGQDDSRLQSPYDYYSSTDNLLNDLITAGYEIKADSSISS